VSVALTVQPTCKTVSSGRSYAIDSSYWSMSDIHTSSKHSVGTASLRMDIQTLFPVYNMMVGCVACCFRDVTHHPLPSYGRYSDNKDRDSTSVSGYVACVSIMLQT
jgi:hypothetical protein